MEVVAAKSLSNEEVVHAFWRGGNLRYKLDAHQRTAFDAMDLWEAKPIEIPVAGTDIGSARWWVDDWGRRVGKTYKNGIRLVMNGMRRPGARMIYATRTEVQMKEILVPVIEDICADAPEDLRPKFFSSRWGMRAGYHFPANDSVLKLVGLDKDPDGLRGPFLDWCAISEGAFLKQLRKIVGSIIGPQFMRRPWARGYIESSAPEDPDHDFDTYFVPDAKRRGAYWFYTFEDIASPKLREEARLEYEQAKSTDKVSADREYKGIRSRDFNFVVIPEFSRERFVQDVPRPEHAYALAGFDPGFRHLFGAVWAYYDFERATLVVQDSWTGSNASTAKVACITAAREYDLYGRLPPTALDFIPLHTTGNRRGWKEYLAEDRCERLAEDLHELATMPEQDRPDYEHRPGKFVRFDRPNQWTHYDNVSRHEFMPNPDTRVADVDLKLIADMRETFGFDFQTTTKETLRGMVGNTRRWFTQGRIVFLPTAGPVIDHVQVGRWSTDRTHFDEHKVYAHFDALSALVYLTRYAELIENLNPMPPVGVIESRDRPGAVVERMPWQAPHPYELEVDRRIEAFEAELAAERGRMRDPVRMRPFK